LASMPFLPELFLLFAINFFLALSLISCLLEKLFPAAFPYLCQVMALAGYGQLWVHYTFLQGSVEVRFWCSLVYLAFVVAAVSAVNIYIAITRHRPSVGGIFLGGVTLPTMSIAAFVMSCYVNGLSIPMPKLPSIPMEAIQTVLAIGIVVLALSVVVYAKEEKALRILARAAPITSPGIPTPTASLKVSLAEVDRQFEKGEISLNEYIQKRKSLVKQTPQEKTWIQKLEEAIEKLPKTESAGPKPVEEGGEKKNE